MLVAITTSVTTAITGQKINITTSYTHCTRIITTRTTITIKPITKDILWLLIVAVDIAGLGAYANLTELLMLKLLSLLLLLVLMLL